VVFAHPHIWIEARSAIVFDNQGAISAIRHQWTFDEAFSAWSIQGLDTDGDGQTSDAEMQALADENMIGLQQYSYYTFAGVGSDDIPFTSTSNPNMKYEGGQTTLSYTLAPNTPVRVSGAFEIELTDPEYYVAFSFAEGDAVTLENAPDNCTVEVNAPKSIDPALEDRLFALGPDITELPEDLKSAAADLANVVIVRCDDNQPVQASGDIVQEVTKKRASPFAAPPAEKGLPVVRTGFLGWVNAQQKTFYAALTKALGQLKSDGNAFWVLGTLSFLYGVFHAAGPGHGKIVISSYMLATEAQLQRGIVLSFASAMLQSITAIVFVLIAAMALNMTSVRLSETSNLLVVGSYVLVTALGLWLVVRKVFGLGNDHDHDHGEHNHHVVTPTHVGGGLREMIGVVLAVGLRPCSGALVVLVFALSQGVLAAGIAAVFLMGLGTSITVGVLATLAVGAKNAAHKIGSVTNAEIAADISWWLELAGALLVFGFGAILLMANI